MSAQDLWEKLDALPWPAPWVAGTFEIECPCPNGDSCGDPHTCEQVDAREAYPWSSEAPAEAGDGQCVVQIDTPGLEMFAKPCAEFIAAARNELPGIRALLAEKDRRIAELEKQLSELTEQYKLFIDRTIEHAAEHTMRTSARIAELDGRLAQRCACGRTSAGKLFFVEGAEWVHTAVLCQPVHSTRIAELEGALKVILRIAAEDDEDVGAQLNDIELKASLALSPSGGAT